LRCFLGKRFLTRIPTKSNLLARGMHLSDEFPNCVLCRDCVESENHIFLTCPFAWDIWVEVYRWFEVFEVPPGNIWTLLDSFFILS
jgi:hypothetical protein